MALTADEIEIIVNPALDRIAAGNITESVQTSNEAIVCNKHYAQTRDSLLRSFIWPFATTRTTLTPIYTMTLDASPATNPFTAGDILTGATSGTTAVVLTAVSSTEYEIYNLSGDFTDGEDISNNKTPSDIYTGAAGYPKVEITTPAYKWTYQYPLPDDCLRLVSIYEDDGSDYPENRWTIEGRRILTNYSTLNIQYIQKITNPLLYDELFKELFILRLAMKLVNPLAGTAAENFKAELRDEIRTAEYKARCVAEQENNTTGRTDWILARYGV